MPKPRPCLVCGHSSVSGASRCAKHGGRSPRGKGEENPRRALYRTRAWQQVARQAVASADVCALCGRPPTPTDPLEADHIVPLALGGEGLALSNLRAAHKSCNARRGAQLGRELRAARRAG